MPDRRSVRVDTVAPHGVAIGAPGRQAGRRAISCATLPDDCEDVAANVPVAPAAARMALADIREVNWLGEVPIRSQRSVKPAGGVQVEPAMFPKMATSIVFATGVVIDGAVAVVEALAATWPPEAAIGLAVLTPL